MDILVIPCILAKSIHYPLSKCSGLERGNAVTDKYQRFQIVKRRCTWFSVPFKRMNTGNIFFVRYAGFENSTHVISNHTDRHVKQVRNFMFGNP